MSETRYVESEGATINAVLESVSVDLALESRDAADFEVVVSGGGGPPLDVGAPVGIWTNPTDGTDTSKMNKLFGGTVEEFEVEDYTLGSTNDKLISYRLTGWSHIADRFLANKSYTSQAAGAIVEDLRSTYLAGDSVTAGTIDTGPTIEKAVFPRWKVSRALTELAKRAGMTWYIDELKQIHFLNRETNTAPVQITEAASYYRSLRIERGREKYRNRQIVQAGEEETAEQTDSFDGDGSTRQFTCRFPLASEPTIDVDGTPKTVGINGKDSGKDFYWNKGSQVVAQDKSNAVLVTGDTLNVTYTGLVDMVTEARSQTQIDTRKAIEGGSGVYESVTSRPEIDDRQLAFDTANALLRRWGTIDKRVTLTLEATSTTSGLRAGQLLTISLPAYDLDGTFLIEEVRAKEEVREGDPVFEFKVVALSGNKIGAGWVDFFRELSELGKEFVINENEVLTKLESHIDEIGLADSLNVSEAEAVALADTVGLGDSLSVTALDVFVIGSSSIGSPDVIG